MPHMIVLYLAALSVRVSTIREGAERAERLGLGPRPEAGRWRAEGGRLRPEGEGRG